MLFEKERVHVHCEFSVFLLSRYKHNIYEMYTLTYMTDILTYLISLAWWFSSLRPYGGSVSLNKHIRLVPASGPSSYLYPCSFYTAWIKWSFKNALPIFWALVFLFPILLLISPFHYPIYLFLYSKIYQLNLFCWFISLLMSCFSLLEVSLVEPRNLGCLVLHWIPRVYSSYWFMLCTPKTFVNIFQWKQPPKGKKTRFLLTCTTPVQESKKIQPLGSLEIFSSL